jgi:HSP20 family protein
MFDRAWLEKALELQKMMKEMSDHNWHFDKSWLDKAMEMQKMIPGPAIDSNWYKEILGGMMKLHPGSGMFNFPESGEPTAQQAKEETAAPGDAAVGPSGGAMPGAWQPQFTIMETAAQVTLTAYIPGIRSKDDISVRLHGNTLSVSGKNQDSLGGRDGRTREFYRALMLPGEVRSDGASAQYANGSLTVKIPKNRPVSVDLDFTTDD